MVCISRRLGTLVMVTGSDSRMQAKRMGKAAFLEPLTSMPPVSGTPPSITSLSMGEATGEPDFDGAVLEARKSIKEKSVTCLECGKSFKILTKRHLATHGLSTEEYLEKWGFKKGTPLACKALQRERRKKMNDMLFLPGMMSVKQLLVLLVVVVMASLWARVAVVWFSKN